MNKFAVVFPGQGSQYSGMGVRLYEDYVLARKLFDEASERVGFDLLGRNLVGSELYNTTFAQPAIFSLSVIAYRVFQEQFSYLPHFFAGHSLGEYSALVCSSALDFFEGLKLVQSRAKLMAGNLREGSAEMCAVENISLNQLNEVMAKFENVYISNINSMRQIVISGLAFPVEQMAKELNKLGAQTKLLKLNLPFHTPLLKETVSLFETELKHTSFNFPQIPVISNVTAKPYESVEEMKRLLSVQIISPVKWLDTMQFFVQQDCDHVLEIGPKRTLLRFFNDSFPTVNCQAVEFNFKELSSSWFEPVSTHSISHSASKALTVIATTKNKTVFQPEQQRRIQSLYSELKKLHELKRDSLEEVNAILKEVLRLKGYSSVEIAEYFIQNSHVMHLFCFPYAGGSANLFKDWSHSLPPFIEVIPVEYPGRGVLSHVPPLQQFDHLLDELEKQVKCKISSQFAFFGHSLGALVAYELAQQFKNKYRLEPSVLCLSACPSPDRLGPLSQMGMLDDQDFIERVEKLNGTPEMILKEEVFKDFFLPILRADFRLLDHYQPSVQAPLNSSFLLFGGREDQTVKREDIEGWKTFSQQATAFYEMSGDHFFIRHPNEMLKLIEKKLQPYEKRVPI